MAEEAVWGGIVTFSPLNPKPWAKASSKQSTLATKTTINSMKEEDTAPATGESLSMDESMKWCRRYFIEALEMLSKDPDDILNEYEPHAGIAWELREDVLSGKPLVEWDEISSTERYAIKTIITEAEMMPNDSSAGYTASELYDAGWEPLRYRAKSFLSTYGNVLPATQPSHDPIHRL